MVVASLVLAIFVTTGCIDRAQHDKGSQEADTLALDTLSSDSIFEEVEETPMPVAADELFDDFFFNFVASRKVQGERVRFPLQTDNYGKQGTIEKKEWKREGFFMKQGYYTLIFNEYKQVSLPNDTTVSDVTVERLAVARGVVTRWHFTRTGGLWYMDKMSNTSLKEHPDAAFLAFYEKFASDSVFQQEHLCDPVIFSGPNPDDDFSMMTGELMPEQWPMFAPMLPSGTLYNIVYGSEPYSQTNFRVFLLRGISNGMQMELQFGKRNGVWNLIKITT